MNTVAELPYDVAKASPEVQARYLEMVETGVSPRMAEMFALRTAPRVMTDNVFLEGRGTLDKQFSDAPCGQLDQVIAEARRHGYEPGINDVYDSGLARFVGDPQAFIAPSGGRGQVKRTCEERGTACHGAVEVKRREPENEPENVRLAPDLANEIVDGMLRENPDLRHKVDRRELVEEAVSKHGYDDSKLTGELSRRSHAPSSSIF